MLVEQHAIHIQASTEVLRKKLIKNHSAIGLFLILLGILFIFKQIDLIRITWPLILMTVGVASLIAASLNRSKSGVFPGVFLALLGLVLLADSKNWITGGVAQNWPLLILAVSFSFLGSSMIENDRRRHWNPGLILFFSSGFLLVVEYGWVKWGVLNEVLNWWPILLIMVGIWFIFRKQSHRYL